MTIGETMSAVLCCLWLLHALAHAKNKKQKKLCAMTAAVAIFFLTITSITGENFWAILFYLTILAGTGGIFLQIWHEDRGR